MSYSDEQDFPLYYTIILYYTSIQFHKKKKEKKIEIDIYLLGEKVASHQEGRNPRNVLSFLLGEERGGARFISSQKHVFRCDYP